MYQQSVGKNNGSEKSRRKSKPGLFFIVWFFIVQNECFFKTTLQRLLLSLVWFCESTLLSICFVHCWPHLKHVCQEHDCNTIAFLWSSSMHIVNTRGSVISLADGLSSWHIPLCLEGGNVCSYFKRIGINMVCRIDGFPWNLVWTFIDRYGKLYGDLFYCKYFFHGGL